MNKRIILFVMSSLFFTAGCTTETTTSTTDSIATEARQDQTADLIRVDDRVYQLDGKDPTIKKADVTSFSTVTKQLSSKQPLVDRTATHWQSGTKLYRNEDATGVLYVFKGATAYRYTAIPEG
ncbi:hypothetical protein [Exiguobacterium antarcticum]|uniref:Lipoprotein n=1 Tax=Exiguobacterium antarcticum TaxID=132920 RepID=A0ABT6R5U9_9BACL|nr:hypothetical protein [Exiguobacterium antarcticum]AFS70500.1 Hypothetical protein Eab7_1377 [Exiguobacterium antarcticum B7]MDI3236333.1 hypothetical protein [Exiguobacterium antarcticum]